VEFSASEAQLWDCFRAGGADGADGVEIERIELETALTEFRTADGIRVPFSSYLATATI